MGVSKELLDKFYDLADFEEQKRHNAVIAILDEFEQNASYCMGRLIAGLASSRAAARLGYTNALSVILATVAKDWPAEALFQLADQKLPLNKEENLGSALGQHLLHLAMVNSDAYKEDSCEIIKRELKLLEKQSGLLYSASDLLARCANKLKRKEFTKNFWPLVRKNVTKPLDSLAPEWFYFALQIVERHRETLETEVSFLSADGNLYISDSDCEKVVDILKKASGSAEDDLIFKLLSLSRTAGNFEAVYSKIVEKWLYHGDVHKAISRSVPFVNKLLQQFDFQTDELVSIYSSEFVRMIRSLRKSNEFRFLQSSVEAILLVLKESLSIKDWTAANIIALLEHFDKVGNGNFDEYFGGKIKITEKILIRLCDDVHEIVSEALHVGGWRIRRISNAFSHWPVKIQRDVLKLFLENFGSWTEDTANAFCGCIASLFIVSVRAGRNVTAIYKEEHNKLLRKFIKKHAEGTEPPSTGDKTLTTFMTVLSLWTCTTPHPDDRVSYKRAFDETMIIWEKLADANITEDMTVLNDLMLSLLSQPHRYHRSVVHFVFASFIPRMKLENLLHIFEVINLSDEELMQEKDESEMDDEEGTDGSELEESEQADADNEADYNNNDQHEETDDSEFEEEDEEGIDVDEEFTDNLKKALGPAAARSDDEIEEDSASSTVSDETMFRLDEGLAAVFRKRKKTSRTLSAALVEQAQQFRAKCFDLLLIAVSHQEGTCKAVDLILPLIECAQQALRRKDGEFTVKKATNLLEIILKHKKGELSEKKAVRLLDDLAKATLQTVNPVMRNIFGNVASFLFSACYDTKENVLGENMRNRVVVLLKLYMTDSNCQNLSEVVTAPFIKYPQALLSELPRLIDFAFDENVRAFQRAEALSCAVPFLRKDLMKREKPEEQKIWKKVTKSLCTYAGAYFSTLNLNDAKPRFFAYLIRILTAFASIMEESNKGRLRDCLAKVLKKLCDNTELWKIGNRIKRFNSTSQSICGRNALSSLRQLLNILEGR